MASRLNFFVTAALFILPPIEPHTEFGDRIEGGSGRTITTVSLVNLSINIR